MPKLHADRQEERPSPDRSPHEVQTNGPFIYVAVIPIQVLGTTQLAYQFANLVFVAGLLAVLAFVLRRESLAVRVVGPGLVLMAAPMLSTYGLGGLGEVPMTCFILSAVAGLVEAVRTPHRAPWWVLGPRWPAARRSPPRHSSSCSSWARWRRRTSRPTTTSAGSATSGGRPRS